MANCCLCDRENATEYPARRLMLCSPCEMAVCDMMDRATFVNSRWTAAEADTLPATYKAMIYVAYLKGETYDDH